MKKNNDDNNDNDERINQEWDVQRDLILRLLPPTATLAGLCLAGVSLFSIHPRLNKSDTIIDDILAVNALLFLISFYLTMWSVRTKTKSTALKLSYWVDHIFLLAITLLVLIGFLMVYTVI
jgi:hypothetical protein